MARQKKDYVSLTVKLDKKVYDRLSSYCDIAGQTKTIAVERALINFINAYAEKEDRPELYEDFSYSFSKKEE